MKSITIPLPEEKHIEINGNVFTLHSDDVDILDRALELETKYTGFKSEDSREIIAGIKEIITFINDTLGDKMAMKKIAGGRSVNLLYAVKTMRAILDVAVQEYGENVAEEYE